MPITNIRGQQILNNTVQYVDIQQVAASRLLGNPTGSAATMSEISLGTGLSFSGSSLVLSANLQSLSGLSYSSASFVKMTAAGTFALDTNTYITGAGTTNYLPKWTSGSALGNSLVYDDGTTVRIGSLSTSTELLRLSVNYNASNTQRGAITWHDGTGITGKIWTTYNGSNRTDMFLGGLYNSAYDQAAVVSILGTGLVGIGRTSPITKLHIDKTSQTIGGTTPNGGLVVTNLAGSDYALEFGTDSSLAPWIQSRNATSATYYSLLLNPSGGSVGIGTTSPLAKFHLVGELRNSFGTGVGGTNYLNIIDGVSNGFRTTITTGNAITYTFHNGANTAVLNIVESGAATFSSSVTASGAVTSGGDFFLSGASKALVFNSSVNFNTQIYETSGSLVLRTGGTDRLTITSAGAATFSSSVAIQSLYADLQNTTYVRFSNTGGATRWGYIQHDGTNIAFSNDISGGTFTFNKAATFSSSVTASSLIKSGGTSAQFLMADGSVSTNPGWITSFSETDTLASVTGRGSTTTIAIGAPNFYDGTGGYNVNLGSNGSEGRGLVAGYSGGSYGGIGFNVRHTTTGGSWIAPGTDTSSYILFTAGGFQFYGAGSGTAGRTLSYTTLGSFNSAGLFNAVNIAVSGSQVLHASNYSSYSTFSALVTSGGNNGFANDVYYVGERNPIWKFANATSYGISYFQGTSGIGSADTIGIHPNGTATAAGSAFSVTPTNSYVNNNVVWHAGNLTNLNQLTNGPGYTTNTGTVTSVSGTGTVSGLTLTGTVTSSGSLTLSGTLTLTSGDVTTALGYTPYNATNPNGYITSSSLGAYLPLAGGTMTGNINWGQTDRGLTWGMNTDGAYIKFFNTGDGDADSRLEYNTSDNGDEYHRFLIAGIERFTIKNDAARFNNNVVWHAGNDGSSSGLDADLLDGNHATGFGRAYSSGYSFHGTNDPISTATFISILTSVGAFSQPYWTARGSWCYACNGYINDTGLGDIHLAGCTVEVMGDTTNFTIRIHTPTTSNNGVVNREYIYVQNSSGYSPGWRILLNNVNYTDYTVTKTGTGASGTWGINITGNAATATALTSMNISQFTNNSGYITGESDTLASVTGRGASTSTAVTLSSGSNSFNGHHYFIAYDANGNHYPHYNVGSNNNGAKVNLRVYSGNGSSLKLFYLDGNSGGFTWDGNTVWHSGNDGSGSSLDADLLDGNHASAFALASHTHTLLSSSGDYVWNESTAASSYSAGLRLSFVRSNEGWFQYGTVITAGGYSSGGGSTLQMYIPYSPTYGGSSLKVRFGDYDASGAWTSWKTLWDNSNLTNLDQLTNGPGYITGISFANVSSKPTTLSGYGITDSIKSNGTISNNIDLDWGESFTTFDPIPSGTPPMQSPNLRTINVGPNFARRTQLAFDYATDRAFFRRKYDSAWYSWVEFIHTGNYNSYSPTLTGTGASGSWGISITGNAATATDAGSVDGIDSSRIVYGDGSRGKSTSKTNANANTSDSSNPSGFFFGNNTTGMPSTDWWNWINVAGDSWSGTDGYGYQLANSFWSDDLRFRRLQSGTWYSWISILTSGNYNSYAPTLTGGGASGTWGINVTGNSNNITQYTINQSLGTGNSPTFANLYLKNSSSVVQAPYQSDHDFPTGAYIQTDILVGSGQPWTCEITAFNYGDGRPTKITINGYNYGPGTYYNGYAISTGKVISGMSVFQNAAGYLCLYIPSQGYWNAYNVIWYVNYNTNSSNRVTSITNAAKPGGISYENAISPTFTLDAANYNSYAPTLTGTGASGTWGISISGNAATATYASSAGYATFLPTAYTSGVQTNPQVYFNNGIGLRVAMTGAWATWSDTLWINGYGGSDVPNMCALHTLRDGTPRIAISTQERQATSYGTIYQFLTEYNWTSYAPTKTGGGASGTWSINVSGTAASETLATVTSRGNSTTSDIYINNASPTLYLQDTDQRSAMIHVNSNVFYVLRGVGTNSTGWTPHNGYWPMELNLENNNATFGGTLTVVSNINGNEIYNSGWYRNSVINTGLYSSYSTMHLSSKDNGYWDVSSTTTNSSIRFWTGSHMGALRGYVYATNSNEIGFLDSAGAWVLRCLTGNSYLTGTFTASGDVVAYSDARIKTNVQTIDNALEKVTSLRGVTYNRTDVDDKSEKVGVIAQEIQEVLPQVVTTGDDGMLGVSYGNLAGVFIEAIKEQQKQIEDLKKQIEYLVENR